MYVYRSRIGGEQFQDVPINRGQSDRSLILPPRQDTGCTCPPALPCPWDTPSPAVACLGRRSWSTLSTATTPPNTTPCSTSMMISVRAYRRAWRTGASSQSIHPCSYYTSPAGTSGRLHTSLNTGSILVQRTRHAGVYSILLKVTLRWKQSQRL